MQCRAKTRSGQPCKSPPMVNGRCRMHGGMSTGRPIIHGRYTQAAMDRKREWRQVLRELEMLIKRAED